MRPLRSVNLIFQESIPWDSPLCQLEILQSQPVQYTTIRWAHCLNFQHCPKYSRQLPGTGKSKRTLLRWQDWGLLDGFFKYRYSSSYKVLSPFIITLQCERRPEIFYLSSRWVVWVEGISPSFLRTEKWCLLHWLR